jgi:hypothetical protein
MNYVEIPTDDYNMTLIHTKYRANRDDYVTPYYREDDPKHMMTFFNEFIFNLQIQNCFRAYYWLEFILGYEKILHKYKEKSTSGARTIVQLTRNYSKDIIWIVWEIILKIAEEKGAIYKRLVTSTLNIFTIKYSPGSKQSKKYLIYFSISLLTSNVDMNIPIFNADIDIDEIMNNTTQIYNQLIKIQQINLLL